MLVFFPRLRFIKTVHEIWRKIIAEIAASCLTDFWNGCSSCYLNNLKLYSFSPVHDKKESILDSRFWTIIIQSKRIMFFRFKKPLEPVATLFSLFCCSILQDSTHRHMDHKDGHGCEDEWISSGFHFPLSHFSSRLLEIMAGLEFLVNSLWEPWAFSLISISFSGFKYLSVKIRI